MSEYLTKRVLEKAPELITQISSSINYDTTFTFICEIHGTYTKKVKQILYKNTNCPTCTRLARNKKLSDIGKTKTGEKNSFYGKHHSKETKQKLSDAWTKKDNTERKKKISNTVKSKECQDKTKKTNLEKYGNENYRNVKQLKSTMNERYGGIGNSSLVIRSHMQATCQEKYGVNSVLELQEVREKGAKTMLERYGVDNAYKRPENQIKARQNYTGKITRVEQQLITYIKSFYYEEIKIHYRMYTSEIDIYLPKLHIGIEYNGNYWHSFPQKSQEYHLNKSLHFRKLDIRIIHIYEFEDIEVQKQLLKDLILGHDNYPKEDFNKNNLIEKIPKPEIIFETDNYTIYGAGKLY